MNRSALRAIPSVDALVKELDGLPLPRAARVALVRRELADIRKVGEGLGRQQIISQIRTAAHALCLVRIQPVINGTGVLVHTNLGRAPLGNAVVQTLASVASNYNNLELDLTAGLRGGRAAYLEHNLALLCGAEAATVVNNGAAALVLILRHFVRPARPRVIISRGELIQIGGGFRVPEILESAGAELCEIGTTNKTSLADYSRATSKQSAMILKVHRSNFFMDGFVDSPAAEEIADLARKKRIPFVEDQGSGAVIQTQAIEGLEHEPTPAESIKRGVDLVCFSGDKLLGGPQAGIIAGRAKLIAALKRDPFFRALRCDKLILSALQTTVDLHLRFSEDPSSVAHCGIPLLEMLAIPRDDLRGRGQKIIDALREFPLAISLGTGQARLGGGALPRSSVPSVTLDLEIGDSLERFAARLRAGRPPVIGYVSAGRFRLDLRTIFPRQDNEVIKALCKAILPS